MLGPIAVGLALFSAFLTFIVLADLTPIPPTHHVVVTLLLIERGDGAAAARHHRAGGLAGRAGAAHAAAPARGCMCALSRLFSVIAAVPAILVAIVASVTLDRGLDRLFSTRTRAVIENSLDRGRSLSAASTPRSIRGDIWPWPSTSPAPSRVRSGRDRFRQFLTPRRRCAACRRR